MTELTVTLPDELAKKAEAAGLLSSEGIERALKREAGHRFLEIAKDLQSGDSSPISEEEIQAEIDAARAARRAKHGVPGA